MIIKQKGGTSSVGLSIIECFLENDRVAGLA